MADLQARISPKKTPYRPFATSASLGKTIGKKPMAIIRDSGGDKPFYSKRRHSRWDVEEEIGRSHTWASRLFDSEEEARPFFHARKFSSAESSVSPPSSARSLLSRMGVEPSVNGSDSNPPPLISRIAGRSSDGDLRDMYSPRPQILAEERAIDLPTVEKSQFGFSGNLSGDLGGTSSRSLNIAVCFQTSCIMTFSHSFRFSYCIERKPQ